MGVSERSNETRSLRASEESEDAYVRGKIADFGSVSIVKRTLKMIEG